MNTDEYLDRAEFTAAVRKIFAARLYEVYIERGLPTRGNIQQVLGVSDNCFYTYRGRKQLPYGKKLARLCYVCGVSADWMMGLTANKAPRRTSETVPPIGKIGEDVQIEDWSAKRCSERLESVIKENGFKTAWKFAQEIGVDGKTVERMLKGNILSRADIIGWICYRFGRSADWLLGLTDAERLMWRDTEETRKCAK